MLWDAIRDFFVSKIFGGMSSTGEVYYGGVIFSDIDENSYYLNGGAWLKMPFYDSINEVEGINISLGDYLSTTATIISITIIVVLCCLFIYKIIRLIGGLIR